MNPYEKIIDQAHQAGMDIVERSFRNDTIKGLYCDGVAAIRTDLYSNVEKACVLAEELGHHYTSSGNILDQTDTVNRKQELKARMWAYDELIGLHGIIDAYKHGCHSLIEMAEYLDVTENFLSDCIERYRNKYGVSTVVDDYYIVFIPNLIIGKMF